MLEGKLTALPYPAYPGDIHKLAELLIMVPLVLLK
jgi:hypothetical protein